MKICHVTYLYFTEGNGITNAVVNLCENENKSKDVELSRILSIGSFSLNPNNNLCNTFCEKNMLLNHTYSIYNTIKHMIKFKPDIVNFHVIYKPLTIFLACICCLLNIKYVITPHSSLMNTAQKKNRLFKNIFNTIFLKAMFKKSSIIYFLNENERDNSKKLVNDLTIRILPNGVHKNNLKEKRFNKKSCNLLFLARYDIHHKGIDILLSYIESNVEFFNKNNIVLNMYGSGNAKKIQELVNERKIGELVNVHGSVFGDDKVNAFEEADIYILTSRYEGLPISVLEALSYGLPCIVSKYCNMSDSVSYGCSLQADNIDDFINSLNLLLTERHYKYFSTKAINYIGDQFNWNSIVDKRICDFKSVIA